MATEVTDPAILAELNGTAAPTAGPREVTDPAILAELNGPAQAQGAREAVAARAARPGRSPQIGREAPSATWEDVGGVLKRILPAANKGLAETVGRAIDTVPYFAGRAMGMSEADAPHPVENLIKNYTVPDVGSPQSGAQEMADASGKMLGETAPYAVGGAGLFTKMMKPALDAAPTIANTFRRAFSGAGEAMAKKPLTAIGGEAVAAVESGAIGDAMKQSAQAEGESPAMQGFKESAGQILGPTALQMAPVALATKVAKPVFGLAKRGVEKGVEAVGGAIPESVRPAWVDNLAKQGERDRLETARGAVGEKLRGALSTPESQAGMAEAEKLSEQIPGFKPGVARATNDPELVNTQQSRDTASSGADLRGRQAAYDESKGAIANKLETLIPPTEKPRATPETIGPQPQSTNAAKDATDIAGRRVDAANDTIHQQRADTQGQLRQQADSLPTVDRIEGGNALRTSREAAQRATDAETTRLRGQIGDADTPLTVTPGRPPEVDTPLGVAGSESPQTMTLNQILDRRTEINQEVRQITGASARSPADNARLDQLGVERDRLDGIVGGLNNPGLREYADQYKNTNVPDFRQGASAEVARRDQLGYGGNKVDPEQVGKKFFNPNEESAGAQFDRAMGHDAGARQQMVDNALDDLRHTAVDTATGQIKEGAVAKWLTKNERVLNAMPQTGPEIRAAIQAKNPDALYSRMGQLEQRQRVVAGEKVSKALERIAGPGQNPTNAIHAALNDPVLMRQLMRSAGNDPSAQSAVRRAVFEQVRKEAPDVLTEPEKFLGWMKGNDRLLSVAFTPQHKADLAAIARASIMQNRVGRPEGTVSTPKSIVGRIEDALGITVGSAASTGRGVAQGRTSLAIEGITQVGKFFNRQASKASAAAWDEALANPEAAKMVANMLRGKPTAAQSAKLHAYLLSAGVGAAEPSDKQE